jgi:universal stress protein E
LPAHFVRAPGVPDDPFGVRMESPALKKILVAVDFSSISEGALQQAIALGKMLGASVTAAHVLTDLRHALEAMPAEARWKLVAGDIDEFETALRHDSDEKLKKLAAAHAAEFPLETTTLVGKAYAELIRAVMKQHFDLLVAGTQGMSMVKKIFVGSVAEKLIHYCPAPVWIVPPGEPRPIRKILAPVDFSPVSAKALRYAGQIAERFQASLHVLHVLDDKDLMEMTPVAEQPDKQIGAFRRELKKSSAEHLREFCAQQLPATMEPEYLLAHGAPWQLIDSNAKRLDADLIAMGSVGRGGLTGLLLGNTADRVLNNTRRPLLIVKPDDFACPVQPSVV